MRQWANSKIHRYCIQGGKCKDCTHASVLAVLGAVLDAVLVDGCDGTDDVLGHSRESMDDWALGGGAREDARARPLSRQH